MILLLLCSSSNDFVVESLLLLQYFIQLIKKDCDNITTSLPHAAYFCFRVSTILGIMQK